MAASVGSGACVVGAACRAFRFPLTDAGRHDRTNVSRETLRTPPRPDRLTRHCYACYLGQKMVVSEHAPTGVDELFVTLASYLPADRVEQIRETYEYAERCHRGQLRLSGEP